MRIPFVKWRVLQALGVDAEEEHYPTNIIVKRFP